MTEQASTPGDEAAMDPRNPRGTCYMHGKYVGFKCPECWPDEESPTATPGDEATIREALSECSCPEIHFVNRCANCIALDALDRLVAALREQQQALVAYRADLAAARRELGDYKNPNRWQPLWTQQYARAKAAETQVESLTRERDEWEQRFHALAAETPADYLHGLEAAHRQRDTALEASLRDMVRAQKAEAQVESLWSALAEIADPPTVPLREPEKWREWAQGVARAALRVQP